MDTFKKTIAGIPLKQLFFKGQKSFIRGILLIGGNNMKTLCPFDTIN